VGYWSQTGTSYIMTNVEAVSMRLLNNIKANSELLIQRMIMHNGLKMTGGSGHSKVLYQYFAGHKKKL